jgi:hypothetical protein
MRTIFACLLLLAISVSNSYAGKGKTVKNIKAEGSCAVVGMTAESCQLMALRRARSAAIEQAAGVKVSSATVITNMRLAVDFIKSYAHGYIVNETVAWLPLGSYQRDRSSAPIPEYRVEIKADVYMPGQRIESIGLAASLNLKNFRTGEEAIIKIKVGRDARLAIFNITADDNVMMLYPNKYTPDNHIKAGENFTFPSKNAGIALACHASRA